MQIEDGAGVRLLCPRQEALIIGLYYPDGTVDQLYLVFAKIFSNLVEESLQRRSWNIDLSDDFRCRIGRVESLIDFAMVVVGIDAQLVCIRPVSLSVGREIVIRVSLESLFLIRMGQI